MRTSPEIAKLSEAFANAQAEFQPVPKNKTAKVKMKSGGEYTYNYADLADVLKMALPILSKQRLILTQPLVLIDGKLRVITRLMHASGEWIESDGIAIAENLPPQEFGSDHTYWRRYDACGLLAVAPDEDVDGALAGNRKPAKPEPPKPAPKPLTPAASLPTNGNLISDDQKKRLFALAAEHKWEPVDLRNLIGRHGFEHFPEITKLAYDAICKEVAERKTA